MRRTKVQKYYHATGAYKAKLSTACRCNERAAAHVKYDPSRHAEDDVMSAFSRRPRATYNRRMKVAGGWGMGWRWRRRKRDIAASECRRHTIFQLFAKRHHPHRMPSRSSTLHCPSPRRLFTPCSVRSFERMHRYNPSRARKARQHAGRRSARVRVRAPRR